MHFFFVLPLYVFAILYFFEEDGKKKEGQSEQANLMKTAIEHWHCLFTCHYDGKL